MAGSDNDIPPPPPPQIQTLTQQAPHTVSTTKLPILKKGEYDIWAMKMEHYLAYIDYPIWEVFQIGNCLVSVSTDTNGVIKVLPSKTVEEILARERERKARTTLLMALPEDHLAKFHKMTDAKEMWEAIKSRFGGNDELKKMQKSLSFTWSQVSLIMRTKPGVDSLSFDDLYNNLRVFESDVKGSTASSFSTQNVAFVSENTSSTNEVSTTYGASSSSGHNPQREGSSSYTDELIKQEEPKALVTLDGDGVDWTSHSKDEQENYALVAYNNSGSDTEREQLGDASIEIQAYTQALKKVEAQLVAHQQNQLWNEEKIRFMKIDLDDKTDVLTYHKKLLAKSEKEKEELKAKVEKWHNSSKSLNNLLNSQMSARDKAGLGYGDQMNKDVLIKTANASSTNNVNTTRHNFNSQAVPTIAARKVHTVKPIVNNVRPKPVFHKTYSPFRRPFNRTTAPRTNFSNQKFNIAEVKVVSAVGGQRETAIKPSAGCNWRPKRHYWNKVSKYNGGSNSRKFVTFKDPDYPQRALKNKGIVDSGCSRNMTGNNAYLAEYQDYNGVHVS
ncbi:hypothetical protein Tco_0053758, partial [Tanacetum coccineum]